MTWCALAWVAAVGVMQEGAAEPSSSTTPWVEFLPAEPEGAHKVVLMAGDEEYRSEEVMPMLGQILAKRHGFHCVALFSHDEAETFIDPNAQTSMPGIHHLEDADLLIVGLRFREFPDDVMRTFDAYVHSGKPIIGLRTSTHAFQYKRNKESPFAHYDFRSPSWKQGFGRQVLGETWIAHHGGHGSESTRGVIADGKSDHPILRSVQDVWGPTDVYRVRELPDGAEVLMGGQILAGMEPGSPAVDDARNDPLMPLVWTKPFKTRSGVVARTVTTTMGSSTDFACEDLRRLVVNAVFWAQELAVPEKADVRPVTPFEPSPFGFNRARKNVRAADHRLPATNDHAPRP